MRRILLLGYGKMGKAIEQEALQRGHQIVHKIDVDNQATLATLDPITVDVAIEFSEPQAAYDNIRQCLSKGIPVISGTTGWLAKKEALAAYCQAQKGTFFYASNFSIGMNIFFKLNAFLARLMDQRPEYEVTIEEVHHSEKKDTPSGTAITLAESITQNLCRKKSWKLAPIKQEDSLTIIAKREKEVPGMHTVTYTAPVDTLTLKHTAHSRVGFAIGAVLVAEWIRGRRGVLGMDDFLREQGD